jgi:hypothetical protein
MSCGSSKTLLPPGEGGGVSRRMRECRHARTPKSTESFDRESEPAKLPVMEPLKLIKKIDLSEYLARWDLLIRNLPDLANYLRTKQELDLKQMESLLLDGDELWWWFRPKLPGGIPSVGGVAIVRYGQVRYKIALGDGTLFDMT